MGCHIYACRSSYWVHTWPRPGVPQACNVYEGCHHRCNGSNRSMVAHTLGMLPGCESGGMAAQAWTQKLKTGMSKRAASGESMEAAHEGAASPRVEQQRSHGISSKALHHGATAYPSEMQLQQVMPPPTHMPAMAAMFTFLTAAAEWA